MPRALASSTPDDGARRKPKGAGVRSLYTLTFTFSLRAPNPTGSFKVGIV